MSTPQGPGPHPQQGNPAEQPAEQPTWGTPPPGGWGQPATEAIRQQSDAKKGDDPEADRTQAIDPRVWAANKGGAADDEPTTQKALPVPQAPQKGGSAWAQQDEPATRAVKRGEASEGKDAQQAQGQQQWDRAQEDPPTTRAAQRPLQQQNQAWQQQIDPYAGQQQWGGQQAAWGQQQAGHEQWGQQGAQQQWGQQQQPQAEQPQWGGQQYGQQQPYGTQPTQQWAGQQQAWGSQQGQQQAWNQQPTQQWSGQQAQPQQAWSPSQPQGAGQQSYPPLPDQAGSGSGEGRSRLPLILGAVGLLIVVLVGVLGFITPGWFVTRVFDTGAVQAGVQKILTENYGMKVTAVKCGENIQVTVGAQFKCDATVDGGGHVSVPVRVTSASGDYEVGRPV